MTHFNLTERTLELLKATDLSMREVADGAGVAFDWLVVFKRQRTQEFGVKKVQAVYDFLALGIRADKEPVAPTSQDAATANS